MPEILDRTKKKIVTIAALAILSLNILLKNYKLPEIAGKIINNSSVLFIAAIVGLASIYWLYKKQII